MVISLLRLISLLGFSLRKEAKMRRRMKPGKKKTYDELKLWSFF